MLQSADVYTVGMSPAQRAWFAAEYEANRKDEVFGALLAFFLGTFGAHHFYLRRNGLGVLYALFFWSGIPTLCGFVECFLMPGRVRSFNFLEASLIANRVSAGLSSTFASQAVPSSSMQVGPVVCPACRGAVEPSARFCTHCGTVCLPLAAA